MDEIAYTCDFFFSRLMANWKRTWSSVNIVKHQQHEKQNSINNKNNKQNRNENSKRRRGRGGKSEKIGNNGGVIKIAVVNIDYLAKWENNMTNFMQALALGAWCEQAGSNH